MIYPRLRLYLLLSDLARSLIVIRKLQLTLVGFFYCVCFVGVHLDGDAIRGNSKRNYENGRLCEALV